VKLLLKEVKKRQEHFLPSFLRTQREAEATGMRTPGMVSRSASPQGLRGTSSLGKRKMSQRIPSPRPLGSGQAREIHLAWKSRVWTYALNSPGA
jgi:hypothetical protein